jgi:hypothetical protein
MRFDREIAQLVITGVAAVLITVLHLRLITDQQLDQRPILGGLGSATLVLKPGDFQLSNSSVFECPLLGGSMEPRLSVRAISSKYQIAAC